MTKVGKDARGRKVLADDHVITQKGDVYKIIQTEGSYRSQRILRGIKIGGTGGATYLKTDRIFRISRSSTTSTRKRWWKLYDKYVRPARRRAVHRRHKVEASTTMWPCPVCMNGKEPIRFKIGIQVWDGKRLRVCATRCKRRVLKEVKETGNRTRVAQKYMKRGGQVWQTTSQKGS